MVMLGITATAQQVHEAWVGPLHIRPAPGTDETQRPKCWVLRQPTPDRKDRWFGEVRDVWKHAGPDGQERVVVRVHWFLSTETDDLFRCPMVRMQPTPAAHEGGSMLLAEDIVPWVCFPVSHPFRHDRMLMIAPHWHIMQYFPDMFDLI